MRGGALCLSWVGKITTEAVSSVWCVGTGRGEDEGRGPCACPWVGRAMNERTSTRPPPRPAPPLVPTQGRGVQTERGSISYGKYSARGHFAAVRDIAQGSRSGARTGQ